MSAAATTLVLVAAFAHAGWNLFAKRAGSAGVVFVWLYAGAEVALYAPAALVAFWLTAPELGLVELGFISGSALLHAAYYMLLQRGYSTGDLSLVYPVARGLGPLLAVVGAVLILDERPAPLALAGALTVCCGVVWLGFIGHGQRFATRGSATPALVYAMATGAVIAGYTLWDGQAMASLVLSPIVFQWGANLGRFLLLTPAIWGRRSAVLAVWRSYRYETLAIGTLSPLAYILVLSAFTIAPVAYVAPARELSIVIGTAFGVMLLHEGHALRRLPAAATVVLGVILLALG